MPRRHLLSDTRCADDERAASTTLMDVHALRMSYDMRSTRTLPHDTCYLVYSLSGSRPRQNMAIAEQLSREGFTSMRLAQLAERVSVCSNIASFHSGLSRAALASGKRLYRTRVGATHPFYPILLLAVANHAQFLLTDRLLACLCRHRLPTYRHSAPASSDRHTCKAYWRTSRPLAPHFDCLRHFPTLLFLFTSSISCFHSLPSPAYPLP